MQEKIQDFWQKHPCGAEFVGDLSEKNRQDYEDFFSRYDDFRYQKESHILKNLDRIDFQGKQILEIGLGQGADAEQIIQRGGIYSGVDLTDESVERVKMRFAIRNLAYSEVKQGSALELPFPENSFDIVFSHGVLHHIPNIQTAQKEIARILKPDGKLIVMLYAKNSLNYLLSIFLLRRIGLILIYFLGLKIDGIYGSHLENAKETGIWNYLKIQNFIHANTDGPFNPYSKVYDLNEVRQDFSSFSLIEAHQDFMYAPPLKVGWLPLAKWLGWHLWATMKIKR
ncbi:MAG: class I SAM-dependent methyltransferase [Acidobacteriota bacterium]